jgi:hypothetical protein
MIDWHCAGVSAFGNISMKSFKGTRFL